jgi:hypothetical protein
MRRRLSEDRNQHYDDLTCACWTDPKRMARFKEQPKQCGGGCCANPRRRRGLESETLTIQEIRAKESANAEW